jgi:hypothetical protein
VQFSLDYISSLLTRLFPETKEFDSRSFFASCFFSSIFQTMASSISSVESGEVAPVKTYYQAVLDLPNGKIALDQLKILLKKKNLGSVEDFLSKLFQDKEHDVSVEAINPLIADTILEIINEKIVGLNREVASTLGTRKASDGRSAASSKKQKVPFPSCDRHLEGNKIAENAAIVQAATAGSEKPYLERTGSEFVFKGLLSMKSVTDQMKSIALELLGAGFNANEGDTFSVDEETGTIEFEENLVFKIPQDPEKFAALFQRFMPYLLAVDSDIGQLSYFVKFAHWNKEGNWHGVIRHNNDQQYNRACDLSDKTSQAYEKALLQASKDFLTSSRNQSRKVGRGNYRRGPATARNTSWQGQNRGGGSGRRHGIGYQHGRDGGGVRAAGASHVASSGGGGH